MWQQIILFSRRVMQMICAWPKMWTLSERLSHMRNVQLMKTIYIYIFRVYNIRLIAKKIGSHDMKQTYSSIIIVRNVCVLSSASMIVYLFFTRSSLAIIEPKPFLTRSWSAIIGTKQPKVNQSPQQDTINMHTDLQISSFSEHILIWNMHEQLSKDTAVFQIEFSGENFLHPKLV